MKKIEHIWISVIFLLAAFFVHFAQIGNLSIYILDEAKNASAAMEMWQTSEWVLPTFNGLPRYDKPPLHYYFFGLAYELFEITPFAARFFPALMGWWTICMVFFTMKRKFGIEAGLVSGFALLASVHWVIQFHLAVPDPFLIFFLTASLLCFTRFWEGNRLRKTWLRWMGLVLGLAVLSKGPVAIVLIVGTIVLFILFQKGGFWRDFKFVLDPFAILIFLLVSLPWYLLIAWKTDGVWVQEFFFKHNVSRFASPMEGHGGGFHLTLLFVLVGMMPGSMVLVASWRSVLTYANAPTLVKISLIFSALTIMFFMLSGTKLPNYTAPAYPFLAIMIGWVIARPGGWKQVRWGGLISLLVLISLPIAVYFGLRGDATYSDSAYAGWYFLVGSGIGIVSLYYWFLGRWRSHYVSLCIGFLTVSLIFLIWAFPVLDNRNPVIASEASELSELDFYHFGEFNPSFVFLVKKTIVDLQKLDDKPKEGIVILRKGNMEEFVKLGYSYDVIFEGRDLFEKPTTVLLRIK
ncbi:glycosyltransferase family 39 protein [Algoriphagus sp. NG3]|uniref:ArnT family glycosyltransferase n=1 Tax=Algoriphagus sp. NG3 TaxID=3097546 RepID=UPI002A7F4830|nr:glycosyltransferase family 39 protein [Algoriphagus sp. NG3]WPR74316.1 glycosyltransferase family 39 protein [Algoriphagus sp. NG3]